jgi:hypothetical protein
MTELKKGEEGPLELIERLRDQLIELIDKGEIPKLRKELRDARARVDKLSKENIKAKEQLEYLEEQLEEQEELKADWVDLEILRPILELAYARDPKLYEYYWRKAGLNPVIADMSFLKAG